MSISRLTPRGVRGALFAGLLGTTALVGFAAGHTGMAQTTVQPAPIQPAAPAQPLADFSGLVAQVKPAVVSITSELSPEAAADEEGGGTQSPFGMMQPQRPQHVEARGSGFIIDPNGTVVTNNHVVKGAKTVSITLDDGTQLPAKVIGRDPRTDIAVLRVDAGHKLPYIELGNSDKVKVGEWVVAVGNPFGLGGTVTAGIVSARSRDIGSGPYDNFLQIDAPINRGNSGGPLFTQDGRVVGVNTAILSPTGGSVGIGFAIPSNMVKTVVADIEQSGHVTRGYLGVAAQPVTAAMASALDLKGGKAAEAGALVASVEPESPAAKADVKPGDIITAVDGKKVANLRDLAMNVAGVKPGDDTRLDIIRNGEAQTLTATVASLPNDNAADNGSGADQQHQSVGLALAPLTPEARGQMDIPARTHGALVAEVQPGSPAELAGLQQGDVIVGVGTRPVASPEQAVRAIRDSLRGGHAVALRIWRDGHMAYVAVTPAKAGGDTAG